MLALLLTLLACGGEENTEPCTYMAGDWVEADVLTDPLPASAEYDATVMVALSGEASVCSVEHDLNDESVVVLQRDPCLTADDLAWDYSSQPAQPDEAFGTVVDGEQDGWVCAYIVGHEPGYETTFWLQTSAGEVSVPVKVRADP